MNSIQAELSMKLNYSQCNGLRIVMCMDGTCQQKGMQAHAQTKLNYLDVISNFSGVTVHAAIQNQS